MSHSVVETQLWDTLCYLRTVVVVVVVVVTHGGQIEAKASHDVSHCPYLAVYEYMSICMWRKYRQLFDALDSSRI